MIGFHFFIELYVPNNVKFFVGEQKDFGYYMPFQAEISGPIKGVLQINSKTVPKDKINIDLSDAFSLSSNKTGKFNVQLKLWGFIGIKSLQIEVIDSQNYIPVGRMVGVTVSTKGVLVLGTGSFISMEGDKKSPANDRLYSGDYIQKVNGIQVATKEELINEINVSSGKEITLEIRRNGSLQEIKVTPKKASADELFKIGIWVRDDTQGIGTLTYINVEEECFGALGHGITDVDTHQLMELSGGTIVTSLLTNIVKGEDGSPGEISGVIIDSEENTIAIVGKNSANGIFGELTASGVDAFSENASMPIGFKYDIRLGDAMIKSDVSGEMKLYSIEIERIFLNDESNKGMIIKVVDPDLLKLTNGIIQGMSGSPIIQDEKLIGAVTHVFVQDSTKGYGTFIENMILEE